MIRKIVMYYTVSSPNPYFEALTPNVTVFGDKTFREVMKVK